MKKLSLVTILLFLIISAFKNEEKQKISIAVAANLKPAMDSILSLYKTQHPSDEIVVTYGASGKFYEQISNGAPFDVFFSADMNYPQKLKDNKLSASTVKMYGIGKLVIWSKKFNPNSNKMDILLDDKIKKIAIANPATAPYGQRAIESLKKYKLYSKIKSKLVYGDNIAQAAQYVTFGAAEIGIIALSEALSPALKKENGKYYTIPQESYTPLKQGCIVLKHGKENKLSTDFYNFISAKPAVDILTHFGYAQ